MRRAVTACCLLAACGGGEVSDSPATGPAVDLTEEAGGRIVVAEVDGRPIYGDCVSRQAPLHDGDRRAALDACIDIELLVAEAHRRGLDADPEVRDAGKREMVRALLEREYYDKFQSPDDVAESDVKMLWDRGLKHHFIRDEHRSAYYCRAENPDPKTRRTPPGGEADRKAKILADAIYARLRGRVDLDPDELRTICYATQEEVGGAKVTIGEVEGFPRVGRLVPEFAEPAFAIPAVGQVSPPSRTAWGYDIILLTHILQPRETPYPEARSIIRQWLFDDPRYEGYRKQRFARWLLEHTQDADVERYDENLPAADPLARRLEPTAEKR